MNSRTTHKTGHGNCCADSCESGLRNNYFQGKRLTPDSFRLEQNYLLQRRRMLNRAIYGWGVVNGYRIKEGTPKKSNGPGRLNIGPGLALDNCGRELLHTEGYVGFDELIDEKGNRFDPEKVLTNDDDESRGIWLLSVHYAEQKAGRVKIKDSSECEWDEWDHTCETVVFSLRRTTKEKCCEDLGCELKCKCRSGGCCDDTPDRRDDDKKGDPPRIEVRQASYEEGYEQRDYAYEDKPADKERPTNVLLKRGGCRCLCEHVTKLKFSDCDRLCTEIEGPCGTTLVDLENSVPLACVDLTKDECDRWTFTSVEACGPRRLVKRNDMLFDLIRGCDLTRIVDFGWKNWHRREEPIPFEQFSRALGDEGDDRDVYVTKAFWVKFSRPVRKETLRPDCFAITVMHADDEGGWWQPSRVPIRDVIAEHPEPDDSPNLVRQARIVVDGSWVEDGVRGRRTIFVDDETVVEIEIRGDFIVDCNGQTVDANPRGLVPFPTGNGVPGDSFLSTFRVARGGRERAR